MSRLDRFLDLDDAARDQAAQISTLAGLGGFLIARFLFGFQGKVLGYSVIGIVACAYLVRLWWYCKFAVPGRTAAESHFLVPRRFAMAAASAGIFALFLIAPPAIVEAAVLNRRIRELADEPSLSADRANGIADALAAASNGPVTLPPKTLAIVRDAITNSEPNSAVARAANALVKYNSEINPPALINPPKTDAQRAYLEGVNHELKASMNWPSIDLRETEAAISALSSCIDLAGTDQSLRIDALLDRARLYSRIGRPSEALADVKTAEDCGALDLPSIISIETDAMLHRKHPNDLPAVVSLSTLGLQIAPPKWLLFRDPRLETIYHVELIERRAAAYYLLGQFGKSVEDAQLALRIAPPRSEPVSFLFRILIFSYLKMGETKEALKAADEWKARTGDPRVEVARNILSTHLSEPQAALDRLDQLMPVLK